MKFMCLLFILASNLALAEGPVTFLSISDAPYGAIALQLDVNGKSIGRQTNPWTRDIEDLFGNDPGQYTKLNVGNVAKINKETYTFNASVYGLSRDQTVLDLTKSTLTKNDLRFFIGNMNYLNFKCTKRKEIL